jgi:hypothetical protein
VLTARGEVPVYWLGAYPRGGAKLFERLLKVSSGQDCYGLAKVGKDPVTYRLQVSTVRAGVPMAASKTACGAETWEILARMADQVGKVAQ